MNRRGFFGGMFAAFAALFVRHKPEPVDVVWTKPAGAFGPVFGPWEVSEGPIRRRVREILTEHAKGCTIAGPLAMRLGIDHGREDPVECVPCTIAALDAIRRAVSAEEVDGPEPSSETCRSAAYL